MAKDAALERFAKKQLKEYSDAGAEKGREHAKKGVKTTPGKAFKETYGMYTNDGTPGEFRDSYRKAYKEHSHPYGDGKQKPSR